MHTEDMAVAVNGRPIRFSSQHGQNVVIENNCKRAVWTHTYHGGKCFISNPLRKGRTISVAVSNSGRYQLQLFSQKPSRQDMESGEHHATQQKSIYVSPIYRQKGVKTKLTLNRFKSRNISFFVGSAGTHDLKNIEIDNKDVFVYFDIHYGDISIDVKTEDCNKDYFFDELCGGNIKFSSLDRSVIQLRHPNAKAVVVTDRPIFQGETIHLNFTPVEDATWTFIKLALSNVSPEIIQFGALESGVDFEKGIELKKNGSVSFQVKRNRNLEYTVNGKQNSVRFYDLDLSLPVYAYLELFRVRADIDSRLMEPVFTEPQSRNGNQLATHYSSTAESTGHDVPAAREVCSQVDRRWQDVSPTKGLKRQIVDGVMDSTNHGIGLRIQKDSPGVFEGRLPCICPAGQMHGGRPSTTRADRPQRLQIGAGPTVDDPLAHRHRSRIGRDSPGHVERYLAAGQMHEENTSLTDTDHLRRQDVAERAIEENDSRIREVSPGVVKRCLAAQQTRQNHPSATHADKRQSGPTMIESSKHRNHPRQAFAATEEKSATDRKHLCVQRDVATADAPILPRKLSNPCFPPGLHCPYNFPSPSTPTDPFVSIHMLNQKDPFTVLIENNYKTLVNHLEPNLLGDYLVVEKFMAIEVETKFLSQDKVDRCHTILKILMRFPSSKSTFIKAMRDEHCPQPHILDMLGL